MAKSGKFDFNTVLLATAGALASVIALVVLVERRSESVKSSRLTLGDQSMFVPSAWATPKPDSQPEFDEAQNRPAPMPRGGQVQNSSADAPQGDLLEIATRTQGMTGGAHEMDLPISSPDGHDPGQWQPTTSRLPPQIPNFDPGRLSPQDLSRRMGGRATLFPAEAAAPTPAGWGMMEPESPSGIAPIATPAEFATRDARDPRAPRSTPIRSAPIPRLPIITNSSADAGTAMPDPADIRPTTTPRPAATRLPIQSNSPVSGESSALPSPGQRLPTESNAPLGPRSAADEPQERPWGQPASPGTHTQSSTLAETAEPAPPAAESTPPGQPGSGLAQPSSNMGRRSRAPIIPGMEEDETASALATAPTAARAPSIPTAASAVPQPGAVAPLPSTNSDAPVAKVGNRTLTLAEAARLAAARLGPSTFANANAEAVREAARLWAEQTAMAAEARSRKIGVKDTEVSETKVQLAALWGRDPESALVAAGFSENEIRQNLNDAALAAKLERTFFRSRYSEAGLRELYAKSKSNFPAPSRHRVREIFIPATTEGGRERASGLAEEVRKQAAEAGGDFTVLAVRHSQAPSSRHGGELGWISASDRISTAALAALDATAPGSITPPIEEPDGFRIYQVIEREETPSTFEAVREAVEARARVLAAQAARESAWENQKARLLESAPTPAAVGSPVLVGQQGGPAAEPGETAVHAQTLASAAAVTATAAPPRQAAQQRPSNSRPQVGPSRPSPTVAATLAPTPASGRLANLLARFQGSTGAPSAPARISETARDPETGLKASVRVIPAAGIPNLPKTETAEATPSRPAIPAGARDLINKMRGFDDEPVAGPAQDMTYVNMGGGPAPEPVSGPAGHSAPPLSARELGSAIRPSADGPAFLNPPTPASEVRNSPALAQRPASPRPNDGVELPGKEIPPGFANKKPRSIRERAESVVTAPVDAMRGTISGALGIFSRDRDKD